MDRKSGDTLLVEEVLDIESDKYKVDDDLTLDDYDDYKTSRVVVCRYEDNPLEGTYVFKLSRLKPL